MLSNDSAIKDGNIKEKIDDLIKQMLWSFMNRVALNANEIKHKRSCAFKLIEFHKM